MQEHEEEPLHGEEDLDIYEMIKEAKRYIKGGQKADASQLIEKIEQRSKDIKDNDERRRVGYDLLELKTDLKLAELY